MAITDKKTTLGDEPMIPPAEIGDNSARDEVQFNKALRRQVELNQRRASLNAEIGQARKEMKADGIILWQLDAVIRMMEWEPGEVRDHFAVQERYARWAKLPIGTQLDLLGHADDDEISAADWHSRGYSAAVTGKGVFGVAPDDCPPEHIQDWLGGWGEGQAANAPAQLEEA